MNGAAVPDKQGLVLRVGLYILLAWIGLLLFPAMLLPLVGIVVASTLSSFAAAAVANAVVVRIYERGRLADVGLGGKPGFRAGVSDRRRQLASPRYYASFWSRWR